MQHQFPTSSLLLLPLLAVSRRTSVLAKGGILPPLLLLPCLSRVWQLSLRLPGLA